MKIAYVSDVHLDDIHPEEANYRMYVINQVEADYLVLAGDICNNRNTTYWLSQIVPNVKKVVMVKGNHEYYGNDLGYQASYPDNFVCLDHQSTFDTGEGVVFIGDTLWSDISDKHSEYIENFMPDYHEIHDITPAKLSSLHRKQLNGLFAMLGKQRDNRVVIVTHHSPSYMGVSNRYAGHPANSAFHSEVLHHFSEPSGVGWESNVSLWIHGHTHCQLDYTSCGINVVCNPMGYMSELGGCIVKYKDI